MSSTSSPNLPLLPAAPHARLPGLQATRPTACGSIPACLGLVPQALVSDSLTAGLVSITADLLAQRSVKRSIEVRQTAAMFLHGVFVKGPFFHFWSKLQRYLLQRLTGRAAGGLWTAIWSETLLHTVATPFMALSYYVVHGALSGQLTLRGIREHLRTKPWRLVRAAWQLWPVMGLLHWGFPGRALTRMMDSLVSVLWTVFLLKRSG